MPVIPDQTLTNAEFLVRFDWRWVAQNIVEGSTITAAATPPTYLDLAPVAPPPYVPGTPAATLRTLIDDAEDLMMGAAAVGDRYTRDDIRLYGGNLAKWINAGLTVGGILKRRVRAARDDAAFSKAYDEALEYVEALRRGERIFWQIPGVPEAGLPGTANMAPAPGTPQLMSQNCRIFGGIMTNLNYPWGG